MKTCSLGRIAERNCVEELPQYMWLPWWREYIHNRMREDDKLKLHGFRYATTLTLRTKNER